MLSIIMETRGCCYIFTCQFGEWNRSFFKSIFYSRWEFFDVFLWDTLLKAFSLKLQIMSFFGNLGMMPHENLHILLLGVYFADEAEETFLGLEIFYH